MGLSVDGVAELISNVGFPIAISIALFYQLIKTNELVRNFQSTIDKNTQTIENLSRAIDMSSKININKDRG